MVAGAYHAAGADGALACARIVDRCEGKAIVVSVRGSPSEGVPGSVRVKASKCCSALSSRMNEEILLLTMLIPSLSQFDLPQV